MGNVRRQRKPRAKSKFTWTKGKKPAWPECVHLSPVQNRAIFEPKTKKTTRTYTVVVRLTTRDPPKIGNIQWSHAAGSIWTASNATPEELLELGSLPCVSQMELGS